MGYTLVEANVGVVHQRNKPIMPLGSVWLGDKVEWDVSVSDLWDGMVLFSIWLRRDRIDPFCVWFKDIKNGVVYLTGGAYMPVSSQASLPLPLTHGTHFSVFCFFSIFSILQGRVFVRPGGGAPACVGVS